MKCIPDIPGSGQFVAVWTNEAGIWCQTFKWVEGNLFAYNDAADTFDDEWIVYDKMLKNAVFIQSGDKDES